MTVDPDFPEQVVKVDITASRWNPDPPTYETYVQAARGLFDPLLRQYNRHHKASVRVRVQTRTQLEPKLPPQAQKLFTRFVKLSNKSALHPLDWRKFYDFVRHCHARNIKIGEEEVQRLLAAAGFSERYARYIATIFQHGVELLKDRGGIRYVLKRGSAVEED
jgi:hypothetical protein